MTPFRSPNAGVAPETLDALFTPDSSLSAKKTISSGRKRVAQETQDVFSSTPESLERRQMLAATDLIPAEVSVIDDPTDLALETASLRGQLAQTSDALTFTPLLTGDLRQGVTDAIADADTRIQGLEDLTTRAQSLNRDEQTQAGVVADLQQQLESAMQAVTDANTVLLQALSNQQANQNAIDSLPGQIAAQQLVINDAKTLDAQKNKIKTDAYALYLADNLVYQKRNTDYSTYHTQFLQIQTAYQKNKTNVALKDQYTTALAEDTRLKNLRDAAAQVVKTDTTAYNTANADRQTSYNALIAAQQKLTSLNNQLKAAKAAVPANAAAVLAAQTSYKTAQNVRDQKQNALDDAGALDTKMKNDLDSLYTDWHIAAAKDAVHNSAALLHDNTLASLQQDIDDVQAQINDLQAHPETAGAPYTLDWTTGKTAETVPGTAGKETLASTISPDGKWIARGNRAGTIELIDAKTGTLAFQFTYPRLVWDMAFDASSGRLASLSNDGTMVIVDTKTFAVSGFSVPVDNFFGNIQWLGNEVLVGMQEFQEFRAVDVETGTIRTVHSIGGTEGIGVMNGNILTGGNSGPLALLSPSGTVLEQAPSPGRIITVAVSDDGTMAAATTQDGKVFVYDSHLKLLASASGAGYGYRETFLPGNTGFAVFDLKGRFLIYSLSQLSQRTLGIPVIIETNGHQGSSNTMGVTPDGSYLLNNDPNNGIRMTAIPSQFLYGPLQKALGTLEGKAADLQAQLDALSPTAFRQSSLASELGFSLMEAMEENETIGYAKMCITLEPLDREMRFIVRYRVPNAHYVVEAKLDDPSGAEKYRSNGECTEPTADATWPFTIGQRTNGPGIGITFRIRDLDTGEILATTYGGYDAGSNNGSIGTEQMDFDHDEMGLLAENPITPSVKVGKISGPTMLLVIDTPYDQYVVGSTMGGLLGVVTASTPGGATFSLAQITVNAGCNSGYYQVNLCDRAGGSIIDTLTIYFDKNTHTVSLVDPADHYDGSSLDGTDAAHTMNGQQALQSVPIGLSDPTIANIQRLNLYYETSELSGIYNFHIDVNAMMMRLFALPENWKFAPENNEAAVQQLWDSLGFKVVNGVSIHLTSSSQAQDSIRRGRDQLMQTYMATLNTYEQGMAQCMQSAVNMYLGIIQGKPERPLKDTAQAVYTAWSQNASVAILGRLGFSFPGFYTLLDSAKQIFQKHWGDLVTANDDVQAYHAREEYFLSLGLRKTAEGEWNKKGINDVGQLPSGLDDRQLRLAIKIGTAMQNSPRLMALYTPEQRSRIIGTVAALLGDNPTDNQIASVTLTAMNTVDSDMHAAASQLNSSITSSDAIAASNAIAPITQVVLYNRAFRWFDESDGSLRPVFPIRTDTVVGKIVYAGSEKLFRSQTTEEAWEIAFTLQRLTDIGAQRFINILTGAQGNAVDFCTAIQDLLVQGQYGELFPVNPRFFENPTFAGAYPDIPADKGAYDDGRSEIRIRFDLVPTDKKMQKLEVISNGNVIATTTGATFVKFQMLSVGQYGDNIHVTLRTTFMDGTTIETQSDPFNLHPEVGMAQGLLHLSVSDNAVENKIFMQIASHPPINLLAGAWRWDLGSGAHKDTGTNHAFYAADLNLGSEDFDQGQPVYPVADGTVYKNEKDSQGNTTLIIKHQMDTDGDGIKETVWYSKYLHIQKIGYDGSGDALPELTIGSNVYAGVEMAEVGKQSDTPINAHLHFEVLDSLFSSMDIRKLLTDEQGMNIRTVTATDGGADGNLNTKSDNDTRNVTWNPDLKTWVNIAEGLVYDRSMELQGESKSVWRAHEGSDVTKMTVIVQKHLEYMNDAGIVDTKDIWVDVNNDTRRWDPTIQKFVDRLTNIPL